MRKAVDATKDQSYFLHRLTQEQLAPVLFPLGELAKRDVRAIARREGIPVWSKKDSTGICFIGERPFRDFSRNTCRERRVRSKRPAAKPWAGTTGLRTTRWASGRVWASAARGMQRAAVVRRRQDLARNALVGPGHDTPLLYRQAIEAQELH